MATSCNKQYEAIRQAIASCVYTGNNNKLFIIYYEEKNVKVSQKILYVKVIKVFMYVRGDQFTQILSIQEYFNLLFLIMN